MVTIEQLAEFVGRTSHNAGWEGTVLLRNDLDTLGVPDDELVTAAVEGMGSDDRNVRVKMLRVLTLLDDARATAAILGALSDPARRVRSVAIKAARIHHLSAEVVARLQAIVEDDHEKNAIRRDAFLMLSSSVARDEVPGVAADAVLAMAESPRLRLPLLVRLCKTSHHNAKSRAILQEFVESGSKNEAVMATRALCGHMLVRVDGWLPNDVRRRVRESFDPAGDVLGAPSCWIPRDEALGLAAEVGYPHPV